MCRHKGKLRGRRHRQRRWSPCDLHPVTGYTNPEEHGKELVLAIAQHSRR
jgi:hypothetical protein